MSRRTLTLLLIAAVTLGALGIAARENRATLERRWVDWRWPVIHAEALDILGQALEHENKFVRVEAAGFLARVGDERSYAVLERALHDPNPVARQAAALRIAAFEARAVPALEEQLADPEGLVRERAAKALGNMRCEEARAVLRREWETEAHVNRGIALGALIENAPEEAAGIIEDELRNPQRLQPDRLLRVWQSGRKDFRKRAGAAALRALEARLDGILAAHAAGIGPPAEHWQDLRRAFNEVRRGTGDLPPGAAAPKVVTLPAPVNLMFPGRSEPMLVSPERVYELLRAPDPTERAAAASALHALHTPESLRLATERLAVERHVSVRTPLLRLLVEQDPARAVPFLIDALQGDRVHLRNDAASLISDTTDPALVPAYEVALDSKLSFIRLAAITALVDLRAPDRRRLLARALDDPDAFVQARAAGALLMPW